MKKIMFVVSGVLLAVLAIGLASVTLASNGVGESAVVTSEGKLVLGDADEGENTDQTWSNADPQKSITNPTGRSRRRFVKPGSSSTEGNVVQQLTNKENRLAQMVMPGLAGVMVVAGAGLIVHGLRNRPPKRRKFKQANTRLLVQNAGARRRREPLIPATVSFAQASEQSRVSHVPAPQESEETRELRRAA